MSLRVVVADDYAPMRALLRDLLTLVPDVEIVGEASDGLEAVELVQAVDPDLVLLDIEMPRLDGVAAAEVIRSFRPQTEIVLHSAATSRGKLERAAALGLRILDKNQLHEVVEVVEVVETARQRVIEPLVLLALAGHSDEGILIVKADETIPFYNGVAARLLRLPWPSQRLTLAGLRERVRVLDEHGLPYANAERPLARALVEQTAARAEVVCEFVGDGSRRRLQMISLPFCDPPGDFIGVGNYLSEIT
jgi:DNA-binding NarL/FixJ family response regulator